MIPVATISEIKTLDELAKAGDLNRGFALMQQASRIIFDLVISEILQYQKHGKESTVLILCGKGNNGGDGLLAASYLIEQGYAVKCFLFANPYELQNEAKMAYEYLLSIHENPPILIRSEDEMTLLRDFLQDLSSTGFHCFIIDAIYGVGYKADTIDPNLKAIADLINNKVKDKTVIAIDGPSGINNDNGVLLQAPINANYSLAMGFPKLGSFFFPARAFIGLLMVGNLNYKSTDVDQALSSKIFFIDNIKNFFPGRALNGSKYDHGVVINVAGSKSMTGAALLSSKAIYKSGAGLCKLYSENSESIALACPEIICKNITKKTADEILASKKLNCLSIGSGLGLEHNELIYQLVEKSKVPLVLDADAINAFVACTEKLKNHQAEIVITPHLGEYQRLFPDDLKTNISPIHMIESIKKRARELDITILLKGAPSLIADPCGEVFIIPFGNSGLATAGSGDVLTGLIAGFMAQSQIRKNKYLANSKLITQNTILATYLHAKTAEYLAPELTEYSIMASDILNNIHRAIKATQS